MRFLVIVKATAESEAGVMPQPEMLERMGAFNNELIAAGVMLDGAGLRDSSRGKRVAFSGGKPMVTDGPFAETKELIAGYWIWKCEDMDEALAWLRKAPFDDADLEVRPFFEPEDFAGLASDEMIKEEQDWRDRQEAQAPRQG